MPSAEYDLGYMDAAADLLERYLLSKQIYWKMNVISPPGKPPYPSLTLGGLLLAQARTRASQLTSKQTQRFMQLDGEIDRVRSKWRTAWENKAQDEYRSRLNLWRDFLEEFQQEPEDNADRYTYEVGRRVMLHLLEGETGGIPHAEQQMLVGLDNILSGLLAPGEFIWDKELTAGFSQDEYPYLYGILKR